MALPKISGMTQVPASDEKRQLADAPSISIYADRRARMKHYALAFLAITGLTSPELIEKVRQAAEQLPDSSDQPWTQEDADRIVAAVGAPPPPSHVLVTRLEGRSTLVFRWAMEGAPGVRKLTYSKKSAQPSVTVHKILKDEGITIPAGMCLEVPVQLGEDEKGLVIVANLSRRRLRSTAEVEAQSKEPTDKTGTEERSKK